MMYQKRAAQLAIASLFLATIALSLVPVFQTALKGGYRGVPPSYVDDDLYYYARTKEVADGKPFIGNPYFIEHRDAAAPAFFVADWIAAIPLFLTIPFSAAVTMNFIFWSLVFVFFAYLIGRATDMPPPYAAGMAFLAYCEVYWLIFRPVAMQQVFPFFLFFLLALIVWLKDPVRRRSIVFLSIAVAMPFYIYAYLWQVVVATLGFLFLYELMQKKWQEVKALLLVALGAGLLASPAIAYTIYQLRLPFYWETMSRIGLVYSHLPKLTAYYYGRWVVLLLALSFFVQRWLRVGALAERDGNKKVTLAVMCSGFGLLAVTVSNVLTGKELDTASHIGRFITLWVALFFPILIRRLYVCRREAWGLSWPKRMVIGVLFIACLVFLGSNLTRSFPFQRIARTDSKSIQEFAQPLEWIDAKEKQPVVIWADDGMSVYIPILTKHYVFSRDGGILHLMPTSETEDRFLASRMKALTADDVLAMYQDFEGQGPGYRYADAFNSNRILCLIGRECASDLSMREWIGEKQLNRLLKRQVELKADMKNVMNNYHILYLVADKTKSEDIYLKSLPGVTQVWNNNRFVIYKRK